MSAKDYSGEDFIDPKAILDSSKANNDTLLVLAHGAGAGKHSDFLCEFASKISQAGTDVLRFDFPYMQKRELMQKKYPPDRAPKLLAAFDQQIKALVDAGQYNNIYLAGKSMGGRMASLWAAESAAQYPQIKGLIVYGFPFHAPGKSPEGRIEHLADLSLNSLILQGDRDTFGTREEVKSYLLNPAIKCQFLADGNHDFKPRKASGFSHQDHIDTAIAASIEFIQKG